MAVVLGEAISYKLYYFIKEKVALAAQREAFQLHEDLVSTERDLEELRNVIEQIDAQQDHVRLDPVKEKWTRDAKKYENNAANLIETYMKKFEHIQRFSAFPLLQMVKYWRMEKVPGRISREILLTFRKGEEIGVKQKQQEPDNLNMEDIASKSSIYDSAMKHLEVALGRLLFSVPKELYSEVTRTSSELQPLFEILKQVTKTDDKLHSVWMRMVKVIVKSIEEESVSLQKLLLEQRINDSLSFVDSLKNQLEWLTGQKDDLLQVATKFCESILRKKKRILILWSRCHTYGVGQFKGPYGSNLLVPFMEPAETKGKDQQLPYFELFVTLLFGFTIYELYDPREKISNYQAAEEFDHTDGFEIDLKLINALWDEEKGTRVVDERGRIWLKEMKELHGRLEAVHKNYKHLPKAKWGKLIGSFSHFKLGRQEQAQKRCQRLIYNLTMRKRYYCIDSFVHRDGTTLKYNQDEAVPEPSSLFKGNKVASIQMELQWMKALFEDVKTKSHLDVRLKVWLEEMDCVARHSEVIREQIAQFSLTSIIVGTTKIDWIRERIRNLYEWNHTYGIGSIRAGRGPAYVTRELEEVSLYPTDPVAEQVDLIRRELRMMQALDTDLQKLHGINSGTLEAWLEEMREVAREAELLVSSFGNISKMTSRQREKVLKNVKFMKSKIQRLHQRRREYGIQYFDRKLSYTAEEFRARLLADESEPLRIIQIFGAWDNDKAFIKQLIEEDDSIVNRFALQIWLSAGDVNERTLLESIARVMEQKDEFAPDRSLIVLDEIQNSLILNSVWELLRRTSKKIRVILITSQMNPDSSDLNPSEMLSSISMRLLPPKRKMTLLEMVNEKRDNNQGQTTPNDSAANIPSYPRECLYYFLLFSTKNSQNLENYVPIRRLITLWVAEGIVRRKRGDDDIPLEVIAEQYLSQLISNGMVEAKEKGGKLNKCRLKDDKRESCLNKAKEDEFLQEKKSNPGQGKYFGDAICNILRLTDLPAEVNNNSCHNHIHDPGNNYVSLPSHYKEVRLLMSFDTQERSKPGEDIGKFLDKGISEKCFLSLRILDLEHIFRPALPKELSKLIRLRYLGLRWTYLQALPPSVSELLNLQVLDVKHTYISKLPKSIWRMQYLRHLYLSDTYRSRFDGKPYSSQTLKNLQTLWGAFVDEDSSVKGGLDTIQNVRKLGLLCRSMYDKKKMEGQLEAVANWIVALKDLESLRLKSQDEDCMPSDLYLKPLSAHVNLTMLNVAGKLKYPSVISDLPLNLTEVTLSGCELEHDPLHSMEYLPRLVSLRLLANASKCRKMRCSSRGFPQLKVLKLWKMEDLEELEVDIEGMRLLEEFEIRSCSNLKELPERLRRICKRTYKEWNSGLQREFPCRRPRIVAA